MKTTILIFLFGVSTFNCLNAQSFYLIDNPANLPLDDNHSGISTESDRFGNDTYFLAADNFTITKPTKLDSADFFGEKMIGTFSTLDAFNVFIMRDTTSNIPNVNPILSNSLIELTRIQQGSGFSILYENGSNEMDVRVDFTAANGGAPVVLAPGTYWIVAASYSQSADAGDPGLSWQWRYSGDSSSYTPQSLSSQFSSMPAWTNLANSALGGPINASSLAWKLAVDTTGIILDPITTGIDINNEKNIDFSIFPNPAKEIITFKTGNLTIINSAVVHNILGKEIPIKLFDQSINVSGLKPGTYFVTLNTSSGILTKQFIKQ